MGAQALTSRRVAIILRILNTEADPGLNLGPTDKLVLPVLGPTDAFDDDRGIAFAANGIAVTRASFGVLVDGVIPTTQ